MALGLIGKKRGMTRVFTAAGESIPVTVVEFVLPNRVTQVKDADNDGYHAVQVTGGQKKQSRVSRPLAGHFAKAGVTAGDFSCEFRMQKASEYTAGDEIKVDIFTEGQKINVRGISKGKGYAGTVKRHNFRTQDATHGNSRSHRAPGSSGNCQTPGRVFKGKKMAGRLGGVAKTVKNQEIVKIDNERGLILIRGAIPGAPGGNVILTPSVKR